MFPAESMMRCDEEGVGFKIYDIETGYVLDILGYLMNGHMA